MSKGKRKDQRIELSDGWAMYMGDGYFLVGQISDDAGENDDAAPRRRGGPGDVAPLRRGERHESVVISTADIHHMMVTALAA